MRLSRGVTDAARYRARLAAGCCTQDGCCALLGTVALRWRRNAGRVEEAIVLAVSEFSERTPDGHTQVWLLYRPEPHEIDSDDERSIHLWVRRANVFTSQQYAVLFLASLIGEMVEFRPYDPLFPELWIGHDSRGHRWLMCPAPVNPPGGQR